MIMFKLLLIPVFILVIIGLVTAAKTAWKKIDEMEVNETKDDIEHKASLTEDVETFTSFNKSKIEKATSDSVDKFNDTV